jgi:hypothetical protein
MADYLDLSNPVSDLIRYAERRALQKAREGLEQAGKAVLYRATQPIRDARQAVVRTAQAVDHKVASGLATVGSALPLLISDSDWAGEAILDRYLTGRGDWYITDDAKWTAYMEASSLLRRQVNDKLGEIVQGNAAVLKPGAKTVIDATFHAEVENGEGIVGYQYLHGSNKDAGDFKASGSLHTLHVSPEGNAEFSASLRLTWNDLIDPNPKYTTDTWKSRYAEAVTLGRAKAYKISISWKETRSVFWYAAGAYLRDK